MHYPPSRIPPAVVDCLRQGRQPRREEIDAVAATIWRETNPRARPWRQVAIDTPAHCRTIRAALVALGQRPNADLPTPNRRPARQHRKESEMIMRLIVMVLAMAAVLGFLWFRDRREVRRDYSERTRGLSAEAQRAVDDIAERRGAEERGPWS